MVLISLRDVTVDLERADGMVRLVHPISLDVRRGEALGLVGESGSGKTITWLATLGLLPQTMRVGGSVCLDGQDILTLDDRGLSHVRGSRVAMIFQDPASSLNPVHTIGRQIREALATHRGLRGAALAAEARRLLDNVGIADAPRRLTQYPHEFSGGMNQRVMIAMALAGTPDLLVADEPTTALDVTIQAQILDLLRTVRRETGMAMVFISHDLGVVADICERIIVMYAGRIVEDAPAGQLFAHPAHPYTHGLLSSYPDMDLPRQALHPIPGSVALPSEHPGSCAFAPRCDQAVADCRSHVPAFVDVAPGHRAACISPKAGPAEANLSRRRLH